MSVVSGIELHSKIVVKLFITEQCPQCTIAIQRIKEIALEMEAIKLDIINFSNLSKGSDKIKPLAVTPYYVINEKFVVPGASTKKYIKSVISSAITDA